VKSLSSNKQCFDKSYVRLFTNRFATYIVSEASSKSAAVHTATTSINLADAMFFVSSLQAGLLRSLQFRVSIKQLSYFLFT